MTIDSSQSLYYSDSLINLTWFSINSKSLAYLMFIMRFTFSLSIDVRFFVTTAFLFVIFFKKNLSNEISNRWLIHLNHFDIKVGWRNTVQSEECQILDIVFLHQFEIELVYFLALLLHLSRLVVFAHILLPLLLIQSVLRNCLWIFSFFTPILLFMLVLLVSKEFINLMYDMNSSKYTIF